MLLGQRSWRRKTHIVQRRESGQCQVPYTTMHLYEVKKNETPMDTCGIPSSDRPIHTNHPYIAAFWLIWDERHLRDALLSWWCFVCKPVIILLPNNMTAITRRRRESEREMHMLAFLLFGPLWIRTFFHSFHSSFLFLLHIGQRRDIPVGRP